MKARHALIFAGGPIPIGVKQIPVGDVVIGADSGAEHARFFGLQLDLVVGDMDSISPAHLKNLESAGTEIESHPIDKNESDLELALAAAIRMGADTATVIGSAAGRLDHILGILFAGANDRWATLKLDFLLDNSRAWVVRDFIQIVGNPGDILSLFAVGGTATGVATTGLYWTLAKATLAPGVAVGLSNVMTGTTATIALDNGTLLIVQPKEATQ